MLTLVGDPCAINPDARLRAHARERGLAGPRLPHRPQGGPGRAGRRRRRRGRRAAASRPASALRAPRAAERLPPRLGRPVRVACATFRARTVPFRPRSHAHLRMAGASGQRVAGRVSIDDAAGRRRRRCAGSTPCVPPSLAVDPRSPRPSPSPAGRLPCCSSEAPARHGAGRPRRRAPVRRLRRRRPGRLLGGGRGRARPADRAGRAGPRRRHGRVRAPLRPLPPVGLPLPLLPDPLRALAEDLTSETFFRALRRMNTFRWQGKDFGAWLMTIARNLTTDHFKAGRTRLEQTTEDMSRPRRRHRGPRDGGARLAHQRDPARGAQAAAQGAAGVPDHALPAGAEHRRDRRRSSAAPTAPSSSSSCAAYATSRS